jgi:hypothetical protein
VAAMVLVVVAEEVMAVVISSSIIDKSRLLSHRHRTILIMTTLFKCLALHLLRPWINPDYLNQLV